MAINAKKEKTYYCRGDRTYHYKSDLPTTLRPFVDYVFSSGGITGNDFKSFNTKFKSVIKNLLPDGFSIHAWVNGHYFCHAVIKTPGDRYIYMSIPDVRYFPNEWFSNILYRTMKHDKDWTGGPNCYTTVFTLAKDIYYMENREKIRAWNKAATGGMNA